VAAALALIDRDGISGLSMRRLGAELGVDPMAVYYYLPNKAALYDAVVEAVYAELDLDSIPVTEPWREQLTTTMHRIRDALRRHPRALPIVATRPTFTPPMLTMLERALRTLGAAGFTARETFEILNCLSTFTIGHALAEVGEPVGGETAQGEAAFANADPEQHPLLLHALTSGEVAYQPSETFEFGLSAMIAAFKPRRKRAT
jgi:AcrR family transcriptional regulator